MMLLAKARSLQIYRQKGRTHSEILQDQKKAGNDLGGPLRFPGYTIILWLTCQQDVLDKRLDDRVDEMMAKGLINELRDFHELYNRKRIETISSERAYTQGIFQSIGFKEFHQYLVTSGERLERNSQKHLTLTSQLSSSFTSNNYCDSSYCYVDSSGVHQQHHLSNNNQRYRNISADLEEESELERQLFTDGLDALKKITRKYARKQDKWVKNRFLKAPANRDVPPVYKLDSTDTSNWYQMTFLPAVAIIEAFLDGSINNIGIPKPEPREPSSEIKSGSYKCFVCERIFIGEVQWKIHLKSKRHKSVLRKKDREKETSKITEGNSLLNLVPKESERKVL